MKRLISLCLVLVVTSVMGLLVGCGSKPAAKPNAATTPANTAAEADAKEANIAEHLATLSAEDRELVLKQKVCPITGERLGTMGAPPKVDVKGHAVFICCDGCKEEVVAKADEVLAKLGLAEAAPTVTK